jgi:zinc D-Ala-D-Ala carboxypeptidase
VRLSPHFTLDELTVSTTAARKGWDNTPNATEKTNLIRVALLLEQVRDLFNLPIVVNSGYRAKILNDYIGSKDTSQHRIGCAADITIPGKTPKQVVEAIVKSDIPYDQVIQEFADGGGGWIHISVPDTAARPPRKQALIIDRTGTRLFN